MPTNTEKQHFCYNPQDFAASYASFQKEFINKGTLQSKTSSASNTTPSEEKIVVAAVQMETLPSTGESGSGVVAKEFYDRAIDAVEKAVSNHNANLVLLQELFMGPYFCQSQEAALFALAEADIEGNNAFIALMQETAKRLSVVLPISVFEQKNNAFYNSVVMIDADGQILGTYRE